LKKEEFLEVIGLFISLNLLKILLGVIITFLSVGVSMQLVSHPYLRALIVIIIQVIFFEYCLKLSISRWDNSGEFYCLTPVAIYSLIISYFIYVSGPYLLNKDWQSKGRIMIGISLALMIVGLIGIDFIISYLNYHTPPY
jgi:hypothetical protein